MRVQPFLLPASHPYDDEDDTLVGIVNNSSRPISTMRLSAVLQIFGFDGDGITTYGIDGNNLDDSGYGGPNVYYTDINDAQTAEGALSTSLRP